MTQVNVGNEPVSRIVSGETLTVPPGEVWKVTLHCGGKSMSNAKLKINGSKIGRFENREERTLENVVLKGGDTITAKGQYDRLSVHVSGFVVSQ